MDHALQARRRARFLGTLAAFGLLALALSGAGNAGHPKGATHAIREITVLSNRADLISGGDALVAIDLGNADASRREGDPERERHHDRVRRARERPVRGTRHRSQRSGKNVLVARPASRRHHGKSKHENEIVIGRQITIRNHPIGGPVFAGPQVTPFFCNPNASNPPLGAAIDAQCNAPTQGRAPLPQHRHANQFVAVRPRQPAAGGVDPADDHRRREDGAVHRPARDRARRTAASTRWRCSSTRRKPIEPWSTDAAVEPQALLPVRRRVRERAQPDRARAACCRRRSSALGFAVATSSLNIYANNCNDVVSAEATMMTKEIVVERYGPLLYTMGNGGSAASMQQHLLADELPGPARRADHEPGLPRPHGSGDRLARLPLLDALLLADEPAQRLRRTRQRRRTRCSRRRRAAAGVGAATPRTRTTCAGRRCSLFGADRTELLPASGRRLRAARRD